ncbi:MAG: hypothetical protein IJ228_00475 [Succinivibrio sp.]|nr:hypothetical protein [Succinivibrio sp.]
MEQVRYAWQTDGSVCVPEVFLGSAQDLKNREDVICEIGESGRIKVKVLALTVVSLGLLYAPSQAADPDLADGAGANLEVFSLGDHWIFDAPKSEIAYPVQPALSSAAEHNLELMRRSFDRCFFSNDQERSQYACVFEQVATALCSLKINEVLVDISRQMQLVDFTVDLGDSLVLTAGKTIRDPAEDRVMFTLSLAGNTLLVNETTLTDLATRLQALQSDSDLT